MIIHKFVNVLSSTAKTLLIKVTQGVVEEQLKYRVIDFLKAKTRIKHSDSICYQSRKYDCKSIRLKIWFILIELEIKEEVY